MRTLGTLLFASFIVSPGAALASCHLMEIVEIFAGTDSDPDAQYVVLRTTAAGQQFVNGATIEASSGTFGTFGSDVPGASGSGDPILMATSEAATLFSISADEVAPGTVSLDFPDGTVEFFCGSVTPWDTVDYGDAPGSDAPPLVRGCALKKVGGTWTLGDPEPVNSSGDSASLPGSCTLPDGGTFDGGVPDDAGEGEPEDGGKDASVDGSADAGGMSTDPPEDEGCSCAVGTTPRGWVGAAGLLVLLLFRRRRPFRRAGGRALR